MTVLIPRSGCIIQAGTLDRPGVSRRNYLEGTRVGQWRYVKGRKGLPGATKNDKSGQIRPCTGGRKESRIDVFIKTTYLQTHGMLGRVSVMAAEFQNEGTLKKDDASVIVKSPVIDALAEHMEKWYSKEPKCQENTEITSSNTLRSSPFVGLDRVP